MMMMRPFPNFRYSEDEVMIMAMMIMGDQDSDDEDGDGDDDDDYGVECYDRVCHQNIVILPQR